VHSDVEVISRSKGATEKNKLREKKIVNVLFSL
jgi:hypothetical protein